MTHLLRALLVSLLTLSLAAGSAAAKDLCLFIGETPLSTQKIQYWWAGAPSTAPQSLLAALSRRLRKAGYSTVYSKSTAPLAIHPRYQTWPLSDLAAINMGGLLGCRYVVQGQTSAKNGGTVPVIAQVGVRLSQTLRVFNVDSNKLLGSLSLQSWGFHATATGAERAAQRELARESALFIGQLLTLSSTVVRPTRRPLLHISGLRTLQQLRLLEKELLAKLPAVTGTALAGFRQTELTLALRVKRAVRTFDTADYLVVELGKLAFTGMRVKSIRGKKNQIWLVVEPSS